MSDLPKLDWFRLRGSTGLDAMAKWLRKQPVNTFSYARQDKNGDWIMMLGWDDKPDSDWGRFRGNRAAIWIGSDEALIEPVEAAVRKALGFEVPA